MNMSSWIRQIHRWMAAIFTLVVAGIFITLGVGSEPPMWTYYMPLAPLALLMLTGLYMYVLPYAIKWRALGAPMHRSASHGRKVSEGR